MEEAKRIYNHCRACHLNCATYATVRNGRLERIDAVPPEEGGTGKVCARAIAGPQLAYSPTRVRYPLKRAGKRGAGKWERVSWDQAVAEIARKVYDLSNEHGPETFVLPGRTGRHDMGWIAHRIARTIGTPNNYYGAIQVCFLPQFHEQITFGSYLAQNVGTAPSELFVTFGIETNYCWPVLAGAGSAAKTAGMKHIALDPVAGPHALKADEWLPIRPGTDLAYCLCVIRHLLRTGQYRDDFVRAWTNAPFLVREDTGGLLRESDVKRGGKADRYLFWDEASDSLRFWDAGEVQWEGGVSGREHYEELEEAFFAREVRTDPSPATLPEGVRPALFGTYHAKVGRCGVDVACKPAFQVLADNVEAWTPEHTAAVTGVDAAQIERTAEMIGAADPVEFFQGTQYMSTNLSQYINAIAILKTLKGQVDDPRPGGTIMSQFYPVTPVYFPGEFDISFADGLPLEQKRKRLGYYEHRIGCGYAYEEWSKWHPVRPQNADGMLCFPDIGCVLEAAETGKPYPVHGIIAISSNWLMHDPATAWWMRLLEDESKIALHVVTDIVMTPTAEMADYVLPALTYLERNYLEINLGTVNAFKKFYRKAIEPVCEARHDYEFGALLSRELEKLDPKYGHGLLNPETSMFWAGEYGRFWMADTLDEERDIWTRKFLGKSFEECLDERVVYAPGYQASPEGNRHLIAGKFPTDTGKVNLFSTLHHRAGYPALPVYEEPMESPASRPDLARDYPLVLTTGKRQAGFFHSEFRQLPWIREINPVPEVFVNPETARANGVGHGDWIWVEAPATGGRAPLNRIMGKASFRLMTAPGVVSYSQHAWWRPEKGACEDLHGAFEWNAGCLLQTNDETPETGTPGLRSQLCRIYPCSAEDLERYRPEITRVQMEALMPAEGTASPTDSPTDKEACHD